MRITEKVSRHVIRVIRDDERDELKAEIKFLAERLESWHHDVGASSNAMVRQAILGLNYPECWPYDYSDLERCEATYLRAPKHLQKKMLPTLEQFRAKVWEKRS